MSKPLYFTICSRNYMAYALTLGRSLRDADRHVRFVIGLADDWDPDAAPANVEFEILPMSEIGLPTLSDMIVRYTIMELNTAIKARLFRHLMEERGERSVVYLDPDIMVLSELSELEALLEDQVSCVLTPHSMEPLEDGMDPDDVRLMRTGCYNLGFLAMNATEEAIEFLRWWERRLEVDCRVALNEGVFVDQKFMDLAPCYMEDVAIFRRPGYNLAYWNLPNRSVTRASDEALLANGEPLRFVHFSGVIPGDISVFSKHQNRYDAADVGELRPLLEAYLGRLERHGHDAWKSVRYAHDRLGDLKLDMWVRKVYARTYSTPLRGVTLNEQDLIDLCNQPDGPCQAPALTRYFYEIWRARDDLQAAFDVATAAGCRAMRSWALTSGVREYDPDERLLAPLRETAEDVRPAVQLPAVAPRPAEPARPLRHAAFQRLRALALKFRPLYRTLPDSVRAPARDLFVDLLHGRSRQTRAEAVEALPPEEPGVALFGYFHAETGVGEGARRAYEALARTDVPVEAHAVRATGAFHQSVAFDAAVRDTASRKTVHLLHINADETPQVLDRIPSLKEDGPYRIGYWAWELERFPDAWLGAAERLDEIWAPSRFTAAAISAAAGKTVHVIPHPVPAPDAPARETIAARRAELGLSDDDFVAYYAFDFNSYPARKNPEGVLDAFEAARAENNDLKLILKVHGTGGDAAHRRAVIERAEACAGVILIDAVLPRDQLDRLQWCCDAMVSLHRSEGFGLGLLECMAKGKPVIATDYSGTTDFIDADVGVPIPYDLVAVNHGEYPFGRDQVWAAPDAGVAAQALVRLAQDRDLAARLGSAGRRRVETRFAPDRVAGLMAERLARIGLIVAREPEAAE